MSENISTRQRSYKIKKMVMIALFCALAFIIVFVFRLKVLFLTFDAKDAVIALAGLLFGPAASLLISLVVATLELGISDTGIYGAIMNFISSATFSCTVSLIYKYKRNIKGAVIGLVSAVFTTSAVMMIFNLLITPLFMKSTVSEVAALIPTLLLPFNFTKSVLNAALVLVLYKPISRAMKGIGVLLCDKENKEKTRDELLRSRITGITVLVCGCLLVVISILVFVFVLGGKLSFF